MGTRLVSLAAILALAVSAASAEQRYSNEELVAYINEKLGSEIVLSGPCEITFTRHARNSLSLQGLGETIPVKVQDISGFYLNWLNGELDVRVPGHGGIPLKMRSGRKNGERAQTAFEEMMVNCGKKLELFD